MRFATALKSLRTWQINGEQSFAGVLLLRQLPAHPEYGLACTTGAEGV